MKVYWILLPFLLSSPAFAQTLAGKVVAISDGDTITVLDSTKRQHKIRMIGIDAPESKQDFGAQAKQNLSGLVFSKQVTAECRKRDRYGRELCKILIDGKNINLEQIRAGMAWFYREYERDLDQADRKAYDQAEQEAKTVRRGLWQQPTPTPPWQWRSTERAARAGQREAKSDIRYVAQPGIAVAVVGNRSSKIYHRPDCPGYKSVSPKNQKLFLTTDEAERAGYKLAGNCPK